MQACHPSILRRRLVATTSVAATLLSGCAVNPLVSWTRPTVESSLVSLEFAQRYADSARASYQEKRFTHVQTTTSLNSGLLGLGVLGTGLALAKAHRDALIGTAMIGGTAYAFGQQNLNRQHVLIYEAGIDAIGCAKEAVAPLAMSKANSDLLEEAMKDVEKALRDTAAKRANLSGALLAWKATDPATKSEAASAEAALAAAASAIEAGNRSVTHGRQVISRAGQAGDKLVHAVEKIDAAVNKSLTATLPDPSSVFKVIQGLAGFAGGIVPGTEAAIGDAVVKAGAALKPVAPQSSGNLNTKSQSIDTEARALAKALVELSVETDKLLLALARVNGRLPTEDALLGLQGLKDCGVTDIAFPLKAIPERVTLTAGADRKTGFTVSGGTPPYIARLQFTPVDGVSVVPPPPFDSSVGIEITAKAAPQTVPVVVMDSAKPSKTLTVSIEIGPANGKNTDEKGGDGPAPQSGRPMDAAAVAKAINDQAIFALQSVELSVGTPAQVKSLTEITLGLRCKPKPARCIKPAAAAEAIVKSINAAAQFSTVLKPKGAADCICSK